VPPIMMSVAIVEDAISLEIGLKKIGGDKFLEWWLGKRYFWQEVVEKARGFGKADMQPCSGFVDVHGQELRKSMQKRRKKIRVGCHR
jgi:hypothetical protein